MAAYGEIPMAAVSDETDRREADTGDLQPAFAHPPTRLRPRGNSVEPVPILKQASEAPVIAGPDPLGESYLCGSCSAILATNLEPETVWDLGIRCSTCNSVSMTPSLPAGRPLPQRSVVVDVGEYSIGGTIDAPSDAVIAGQGAAARRLAETGAPEAPQPREIDGLSLSDLARRGQILLGDDFAKLDAAYRRGLAQPATPPKSTHRLVELIAIAREDAASHSTSLPGVHAQDMVELSLALGLLERWRRDPSMSELLQSLRGARQFAHALVTLAAASFLTDAGNAVELVQAPGLRRTPDLRLHVGAQARVNTEVKVPDALVRPTSDIDIAVATSILRDAVSSAGTGTGGQLSPAHPGLLIVGGLHLAGHDVDRLEQAAHAVVLERPKHRTHVAGIAIVAAGTLFEGITADSQGTRIEGQLSVSGVLTVRIALNPHYAGATSVNTGPSPSGLLDGEATNITLDAIRRASSGAKIGRNDPCWCGSEKSSNGATAHEDTHALGPQRRLLSMSGSAHPIRRSSALPRAPFVDARGVLAGEPTECLVRVIAAMKSNSPLLPARASAALLHAMDNLGGHLGAFDRLEEETPVEER